MGARAARFADRAGPRPVPAVVELLDELLHESFEMVDADGNRSTKRNELDELAGTEWDPGEFEYRIERLSLYDGRFAIITGEGVASSYRYRSSNVLMKDADRWRAVASHVSGVRSN